MNKLFFAHSHISRFLGSVNIFALEEKVKQLLIHGDSGHDWSHIERVRNIALKIAADEIELGRQVNTEIVWLGAIMHDVADHKFHNGDEEIGP